MSSKTIGIPAKVYQVSMKRLAHRTLCFLGGKVDPSEHQLPHFIQEFQKNSPTDNYNSPTAWPESIHGGMSHPYTPMEPALNIS